MIRSFKAWTAVVLALTLPLGACDDDSGTNVDADTGRVSLMLTDAPGDFEEAVVTISKIYLQGGGGEVVMMDEAVTTDLLTLANDVAELASDVLVPAGSYGQLRLVIDGAYAVVDNGDGTNSVYATADYEHVPAELEVDGELHCPSCSASGLKVNLPGGTTIRDGEETVLLIDFDVAQSFGREAGNSGRWVMNPVIQATELHEASTITVWLKLADTVELPVIGDVQITLGDFTAALTNEGGSEETLAFTDKNEDGTYEAEFRYLIPGTYTLDFGAVTGVDFTVAPAGPLEVDVESGGTYLIDVTVTSATGS